MNRPTTHDFFVGGRLLLVFVLLVVASSDARAAAPAWGSEAVGYFEALSAALSADDVYGVLDFYGPDSVVQSRTSDFQDAEIPVSDYLASHRADLSQDLLRVLLSSSGAITLVDWPGAGRLGAIVIESEGGSIARETVFVDVDSLQRGLLASPDVADAYKEIYREYAAAWSTGSPTTARKLYDAEADIRDSIGGIDATAGSLIERLASSDPRQVLAVTATELAGSRHEHVDSPALYLDPSSFGRDPGRAVAVYRVVTRGCSVQIAVLWQVSDGVIVNEDRFSEVESHSSCAAARLPQGWWTGLTLPGPRDEIVTGTIEVEGQRVSIHNGTERLEELVRWGLERYETAGLAAPLVDSVTFEPTRQCDGVGGRFVVGDVTNDVFLCIDEDDLCPTSDDCEVPALAIRVAMLHEMGHSWLNHHVDERTKTRLLELTGREVWFDPEVAWVDRGVEYAADVLAWGLVGEPIQLEQLGNPPCELLSSAFELLTGGPVGPGSADCAPTG